MSAPNDEYKPTDGGASETGGTGPESTQNDYVSRTGQSEIKVQSDDAAVEEGGYDDPSKADSDAQLQQDEKDAISSDNIIDSRTRGAKPEGGYTEPGDEEGLGGNDGRSRVAGGPN